MNWETIWNTIKNFFTNNAWQILGFFATLVIGLIVIKLVLRMSKRIMQRTRMEQVAQKFVYNLIKFSIYLVFFLLLLSVIGVQISGVITAISAVLLAVGMALQNNIANLANGILIVTSKLFKKGDYISVNGVEGSVEEIHFLFTTIVTTDNKKITIPNSTILNNEVINAGANKSRRIDFTFCVAYETDVEKVKEIVKNVMFSDGRVYLDPAPFCRLKSLNSSSIDFFANCWVDSEDYWDCYYNILETVYNEFKKNNISIPYNQIEVRRRENVVEMPFDNKELPKRVEKVRVKEKKHFDLENDNITTLLKEKSAERKKRKQEKKSLKKETHIVNE